MRTRILLSICLLGLLPCEVFAQLKAVPYASGFTNPIAFIQDPSNPSNQFVVQQNGRIRLVRNGVTESTDFLDIGSQISCCGEQGLLGMAVAPDYATSGRFFVYFTATTTGDIVVRRYKRSAQNPLTADPATKVDLVWSTGEPFIQHRRFGNHNGGNLAFGPDGFLYIATGDGGSGDDPENNAQNMSSLLGKMLRIDVNVADADPKGFVVPPTNPFAGFARPEIWSVGLRNPWRWSFDDPARGGTGALIIGDVGQAAREEIDYEPAGHGGRNYGWPFREGTLAGANQNPVAFQPLTDPIFDYGRTSGSTVTGGVVYRGSALPSLAGRYVFGDFGSARFWSLALTVDPATGEATASDLQEHTSQIGAHNVSTFGADANGEVYFANYVTGTVYRIESSGPILTVDTPNLGFGAQGTPQGFVRQTPPQTIRMSQTGAGTVMWTVSSKPSWLVVSPMSGTGPFTLTVSVQAAGVISGANTGALTLAYTGGSGPSTINVRVDLFSGASGAPTGVFDTPADRSTGHSGSLAVTGWALDDIEVARVRIFRDPVSGEPAGGLLEVGDATLVEGARPDVRATFPQSPMSSRAGWGYLLLTNVLPNLGNGTFRLHAFAEDGEGHVTLLGSKTIGVDNDHATVPFGTIDTPAQGSVVSGAVTNFGWVLARDPFRADPPAGSVQVVIDGTVMPFVPTGWASRPDLTTIFPASKYPGIVNAVGHAVFDSTTLTDGVHTIAWVVTDNQGNAAGIGSRYFTVANGASLTEASFQFPVSGSQPVSSLQFPVASSQPVSSLQFPVASVQLPVPRVVVGRRGFDPYGAYETFEPDADGRITIAIPELGRVELWLGPGAAAHAVTPGRRGPLPIGSHLDPDTGRFTWNPGAGFVGAYDFVFNGRNVRIVVGR